MLSTERNQIGRYVNLTLLGQGGMGAVYRGRDPELDRAVAVKVMLDSTPDFVARFRREAQSIARLTHQNIVQVYDFGVDSDGNPYFVMELIDGTPLDKILRDRGRLPPADAVRLARQAAEGLAAAHRAGIVHRDVKPSNLIVDGRGTVKLVDFGIARVREGGPQLTNAAALMGTPGYMAPEQAAGRPVDHRADIYALGLTLYEMLAGQPPFSAPDPISLVVKNMQEPLPTVTLRGGGVPEELVRLVEQMGAKDPDERLQSCEAVAAALDGMAAMLGGATADVGRADTDRIPPTNVHAKRDEVERAVVANAASTGGGKKRSPAMIGAVAGVLVVAIGVAALVMTRGQTPLADLHGSGGPVTENAHVKPGDNSVGPTAPKNHDIKLNAGNTETAAVLARPGTDDGKGPLRVSVLKYKNLTNDAELNQMELGIGEAVVTQMAGAKTGIRFIERTNVDLDIDEINLAGDPHFNPQTIAKLGGLEGPHVVVVGAIQKVKRDLRITSRFVRVVDGEVLDTLVVTARDAFGAQDKVALDMTRKLAELQKKRSTP